MKNLIGYYYNLALGEFKKKDDYYVFEIDGKNYQFVPFFGDSNILYKIYLIIKSSNIYCHEIILNKDNSILTLYNNKFYLLIKHNINIDKYVDINEIINYDIITRGEYKLNWKNLWKDKIDYYEYQMSQIAFKYPILKSTFNYYIGLTESAIALLNYVEKSKINYHICHRRIRYKEKLCEFFNPIEIIIDNRARDIAEYIKINYINDNLDIREIYGIINFSSFDYNEIILFMSRLLYPSYYFDLYDRIIQGKLSEKKIEFYINKNSTYEQLLKEIYSYLKNKNFATLPEIDWLA